MSAVQVQQRQSNQQSLVITIVLLVLLLLTFLFIKLNHPPVEIPIESVVIDFGDGNEGAANDLDRAGGGQNSAPQTSPTPSPPTASTSTPISTPTKSTTSAASNAMTAEDAQAIAIAKMQKAEADAKAKEEKRLADIIKKAEAERLAREAEEKRIKDQMAGVFTKGKTGNGNGTGNGSGTGKGTGSGTGNGSGNGSGNGNGGTGNGSGNNGSGVGIGLNIEGRGWRVKSGKPFNYSNKEGKIVVSIKVDNEGNVIYAKGGALGSTITDTKMVAAAEYEARKCKLTQDNTREEQFGTIVYNFKITE